MAIDKIVDIKTGQPVKTNERQKRGQDAKRWKYLLGMMQRGEAVIMMGSVPIVGDLLQETIDYIDEEIAKEYKAKKREEIRRRRSKS